MKLVVINAVTLDGVMQGPGRPDEDTRGGFAHGGWAQPYQDPVVGEAWGRLGQSSGLLFGRRTYEDVLAYWNTQPDSPFRDPLNNAPKFVASTTLTEPLPWPNTTLLAGDAADAVRELKTRPGPDLHTFGSGALIQSLMGYDLIDEYLLIIHPLVLGRGRRLFADGVPPIALGLINSTATTKGVIIATYRPVERMEP